MKASRKVSCKNEEENKNKKKIMDYDSISNHVLFYSLPKLSKVMPWQNFRQEMSWYMHVLQIEPTWSNALTTWIRQNTLSNQVFCPTQKSNQATSDIFNMHTILYIFPPYMQKHQKKKHSKSHTPKLPTYSPSRCHIRMLKQNDFATLPTKTNFCTLTKTKLILAPWNYNHFSRS